MDSTGTCVNYGPQSLIKQKKVIMFYISRIRKLPRMIYFHFIQIH